jgi:hypothetical protein
MNEKKGYHSRSKQVLLRIYRVRRDRHDWRGGQEPEAHHSVEYNIYTHDCELVLYRHLDGCLTHGALLHVQC